MSYGTVVVKSMWWPGAYTFFNNGRTLSVYCGDGLKQELPSMTYYPCLPPTMMDERLERKCYEEPNPTDMWLAANKAAKEKGPPKEE